MKVNIKHYNFDGSHFIWFTWLNNKQYALYWECQPFLWWKPRYEKINGAVRFGWLCFAIGWSWKEVG
jgi:hypothetical protein